MASVFPNDHHQPKDKILSATSDKRARSILSHNDHLDRGTKRSAPSTDAGFFTPKKHRSDPTDPDFALASFVDDHSEITSSPCTADSFEFTDIVTDFDSDPCISVADNAQLPILDSFLIDLPIPEPTTATPNSSKLLLKSDDDSFSHHSHLSNPVEVIQRQPDTVCTSPVSASPASESPVPVARLNKFHCQRECTPVATDQDVDNFQEKRMADRAARNRESSRRAREKAKQRLRALENQNRSLLDMVQHVKLQNADLYAQLHRVRTLQQNCSMCNYNINASAPASSMPQSKNNAGRLDRCGSESCRPQHQLQMDSAYRTSV